MIARVQEGAVSNSLQSNNLKHCDFDQQHIQVSEDAHVRGFSVQRITFRAAAHQKGECPPIFMDIVTLMSDLPVSNGRHGREAEVESFHVIINVHSAKRMLDRSIICRCWCSQFRYTQVDKRKEENNQCVNEKENGHEHKSRFICQIMKPIGIPKT